MECDMVQKETIKKEFETYDAYNKEYRKHIPYGSSGQYTDKDGIGIIWSFLDACQKLEHDGYTNLKFENGGDDDILLIDHENKEYGFFEDVTPTPDQIKRAKNLKQLWDAGCD